MPLGISNPLLKLYKDFSWKACDSFTVLSILLHISELEENNTLNSLHFKFLMNKKVDPLKPLEWGGGGGGV